MGHHTTKRTVAPVSRRLFLGGALTTIGAAATGIGFPAVLRAAPPEIFIPIVTGLTGPSADWGIHISQAYQLVFDEVNAQGGIKSLGGAKIRYQVLDAEFKLDVEQKLLRKAMAMSPTVIVAAVSSQSNLVFAPVAEKEEVIHIAGLGLGTDIPAAGPRWTFQMNAGVDVLCQVAVDFVSAIAEETKKAPRRVAIMFEDSYFGKSGGDAYKALLAKQSAWEVVDVYSYSSKQPDFSTIIAKYKAAKVDVVFQANYVQDSILIMRTVETLRFNPMAIIGVAGGSDTLEFLKQLGKTAEYFFNVAIFPGDLNENPKIKLLADKYMTKFHRPLFQANSMGITGAGVIVDALERAGSIDKHKLRDAIAKTNLKLGDPYIVNPDGVRFGEIGKNLAIRGIMTQVLQGDRFSIWPKQYRVKSPTWPWPAWEARA
jgi:branched-chain amino acid transport system substrate-binding protein